MLPELQSIILQPLTTLPFILFVIFLYRCLYSKPDGRKNLPPSPPKLPIIGNLHQLGTHPHRFLQSLSKKHGELMLIHIGSAPALVVSSPRAVHEVLIANDITFANRPISKKGRTLLYNGRDVAAAPYGEYWRQMRSVCVFHLLSNTMVRSFQRVREEETSLMIEKIYDNGSLPVNLSEMLMNLTNDIVCRVAFGRKYREKEHGINFNKLIKDYMKVLGEFNVGDFISWLAWIDKVNGLDAKVGRIATEFDQFLEKIVAEHEERRDEGRNCDDGGNDEVKDFVDVLLDLQKDASKVRFAMDRDSIKALILDMFTGGTDTTSTLVEWAISELLRHPKIMQDLQEEIRKVTAGKNKVDEEDLEKMKYLKAVIKETLRLHPSAPLLAARLSSRDAKIFGYDIPAGTAVVTNAWAIHRDPANWNEPESFNPDRFMNSNIDFRGQDFQFIPFGAGRRICPGIVFAIVNSELVLASLMHKFDWRLPDGADSQTLDMSECFGLTMSRKTPLLAVAVAPNCN
ncbi:norfluorocurarine oxidase-like [Silene latifolia]|uniref:norfluorocurarine oxidase-like n=1 Tax=Silene latifolia TaxID=37657 RepID=UPI003D77F64D